MNNTFDYANANDPIEIKVQDAGYDESIGHDEDGVEQYKRVENWEIVASTPRTTFYFTTTFPVRQAAEDEAAGLRNIFTRAGQLANTPSSWEEHVWEDQDGLHYLERGY